jgi:hypothetical protein
MKMNRFFIALFTGFLLLQLSTFGQSQNQTARDLAVKLQQKVLLSADQTNKVADILAAYLANTSAQSLGNSQRTIESILDKRQKAKYEIVKNDWWNSVQKEVVKAGGQ